MAWGVATALSLVSGCASDPIETYRIGAPLDVAAFQASHGEENVSTVRLDQEQYEYRKCTVVRRCVRYEIDVSPAGRIVGLTVKAPCGADELPSRSLALRKRFDACYPDGRGTAPPEKVEVWIKYEPGSRRIVATCFEPSHGAVVRAHRERTRKPER